MQNQKLKASVKKQYAECGCSKPEIDVIIYLVDGNNFEKQLISDGYKEEVRESIIRIEIPKCQSPQHEKAKKKEIASYDDTKLCEFITDSKTQIGPVIAETIIERKKPLPPKVTELFEKIKSLLERRDTGE